MHGRIHPLTAGLLALVVGMSGARLRAQDLALVGGTLIDGTGAAPRPDTTVVIENGRFSRIVSAGTQLPAGIRRVDVRGKYLIPGLIDTHAHFRDWQPEFFIAYGVTTVLDLGNRPEWMQALKEAVAKGKMKGPRLFRAGMILQAPPDPNSTEVPAERRGRLVYVRTAEEARAEVRRQIEDGADAIKVYAPLSPEQLRAIVEEADRSDIPVTGHVLNARDAVLAGVDFIEHTEGVAMATVDEVEKYERILRERYQGDSSFFGGVVTDRALVRDYPPHHLMNPARFSELTRLMVRQNSFLNPTLLNHWKGFNGHRERLDREIRQMLDRLPGGYVPDAARWSMLDYGSADHLAPHLREKAFAGYQKIKEFLRHFVRGGGKVVAGVDATAISGLGTHQEMFLLVDAGLTPSQALLSATLWSAEMMRKEDQLGSVQVGRLGDVLVLGGNPLSDIYNTRKIEMVIKEGVVQDTELHADFVIPIPRPEPRAFPPRLKEVSPRLAVEGDQKMTLTVEGEGFTRGCLILFDGIRVATRYLSSEKLEGTVPARLLARVGTFPVSVQDPSPSGGISNALLVMVKFR